MPNAQCLWNADEMPLRTYEHGRARRVEPYARVMDRMPGNPYTAFVCLRGWKVELGDWKAARRELGRRWEL